MRAHKAGMGLYSASMIPYLLNSGKKGLVRMMHQVFSVSRWVVIGGIVSLHGSFGLKESFPDYAW